MELEEKREQVQSQEDVEVELRRLERQKKEAERTLRALQHRETVLTSSTGKNSMYPPRHRKREDRNERTRDRINSGERRLKEEEIHEEKKAVSSQVVAVNPPPPSLSSASSTTSQPNPDSDRRDKRKRDDRPPRQVNRTVSLRSSRSGDSTSEPADHERNGTTYTDNNTRPKKKMRVSKRQVQRDRNMLGRLLGTLQTFKQREAQKTEKDKLREEVESKVKKQVIEDHQQIISKQLEEVKNDQKEQINLIEQLTKEMEEKELQYLNAHWERHKKLLANSKFKKTKAEPCIYYTVNQTTKDIILPALSDQESFNNIKHNQEVKKDFMEEEEKQKKEGEEKKRKEEEEEEEKSTPMDEDEEKKVSQQQTLPTSQPSQSNDDPSLPLNPLPSSTST
eukprot:CAMPEP_0174250898 /NCGR_PEP_ID=MMETSP0439-20130205/914_1 /TAXON_ID=0 /ORGANISM="Stereomyxa ramosa, Strain Chinc5" /LENGTH=392 /DNA_ID=CAMNT_0015331079 /DNA_START=40 /DNA_END=1218 /DNA_ORIENTATION=-